MPIPPRIILCQSGEHRMTFAYACPHGAWCTAHLRDHLESSEPCREAFVENMRTATDRVSGIASAIAASLDKK